MAKLRAYTVGLTTPVLTITGTWEPSDEERKAAWEMYVELVTRVPVAELRDDEGLLREALASIYTIFGTTRDILRRYGPDIAKPHHEDQISFGYIAVAVLNTSLRPFLTQWHPLLLDYESTKEASASRMEHEKNWEQAKEMRAALKDVRMVLRAYTKQLEQVIGVSPSLLIDVVEDERLQP